MTLKQEFLDMISLLNPNITEDSYEEDYVIEEDFTMIVCSKEEVNDFLKYLLSNKTSECNLEGRNYL